MGKERKTSFSFGKSKEEQLAVPHVDVYLIGLLNLGNSCFYNTILQALSATKPLASIIAHPPPPSPALQIISPASPNYSEDPAALLSPLPISQALVTILAKLEPDPELGAKRKNPKTFNPKGLLRALSHKYEEYAAATQQDSHEVLRHLIDGIMMEEVDLIKKILQLPPRHKRRLTIRASVSPLATPTTLPAPSDDAQPDFLKLAPTVHAEPAAAAEDGDDEDEESDNEEEAADSFKEGSGNSVDSDDSSSGNSSSDTSDDDEEKAKARAFERKKRKTTMRPFIDSVFGGKLASVVICDVCKNVSLTREDFMDLSLSLKEDPAKMRKRDRIRKSLQAGFFKKSNAESSKTSSGSASPAVSRPSLERRATTSLSETEASESASGSDFESESNDEGGPDPRAKARRASLEPSHLTGARRPIWSVPSIESVSTTHSRERSPLGLGRALSAMSKSGRAKYGKPKIPKPTRVQLEYIHKVLADIPGPVPVPLPPQLRFAQPPGTKPSGDATPSLAELKIQANAFDDRTTGLYACLQQFTAVETLDNENSFACRNCWKLLHPDLVRQREQEKAHRRHARLAGNPFANGGDNTVHGTPAPQSPVVSATHRLSIDSPVPVIVATSPNDGEPSIVEHRDSAASASNPSLISSEEGTTDSSLADEDRSADLADVEEDSGNTSDASSSALPPTRTPLTKENVQALAPASSSSLAISGAETPKSASLDHEQSGASLSTGPSGASVSTTGTNSLAAPPHRRDRHILRKAHKRYLISGLDLPPVLVIHFKRFTSTSKAPLFGSAFTNLKKRDDDLSFPQELDLTPFLTPTEKPPRSTPGRARASTVPRGPQPVAPSAKYRLYAVVVHIGTLASGHYVNYVLSDRYDHPKRPVPVEEGVVSDKTADTSPGGPPERRWFYCSDDEVRPCSVEEVLSSKAYMLFYERVERSSVAVPKSKM